MRSTTDVAWRPSYSVVRGIRMKGGFAGHDQQSTADPKAGGEICGRGSNEPQFGKAENAVGRENQMIQHTHIDQCERGSDAFGDELVGV